MVTFRMNLLLVPAVLLALSGPVQANTSLSVNIGVAEGHQCAYVFSLPEPEDGTCPTLHEAMGQWLAPQQSAGKYLIAHYGFDDNLLDLTINRRDGSPTGHVAYTIGVCGKAAAFDGASKVDIDAFRNFPWGSRFSVSVWFKRTGAANTYQGIVNTGYAAAGSWEIRMGAELKGQVVGGGIVTADNVNTWNYGKLMASFGHWHHAVMTYDGSQLLLYLDNQLQRGNRNCCHGDILSKDTPLTIGQAGEGRTDEFFVGLIDEVKIFGKALSAREIDWLFTFPCGYISRPNLTDDVCPTI